MNTALVKAGGQIATTMSQQVGALDQLVGLLVRFKEHGIIPQDMGLDQAVIAACAGARFGWDPMKSIGAFYVVKGRATMAASAMVAVCLSHPDCEYFTPVETAVTIATYETKRRGAPSPVRISYTAEDAKRAGLWGKGTWKAYPAQMLVARCTSRLARAAYSDALHGMYTREEITSGEVPDDADIIDVKIIPPAPRPATQPGRERRSDPPRPVEGDVGAGGDEEAQRQAALDAEFAQFEKWAADFGVAVPYGIYGAAVGRSEGLKALRSWSKPSKWREESQRLEAVFVDVINGRAGQIPMDDAGALSAHAVALIKRTDFADEGLGAIQTAIKTAVGDAPFTSAARAAAACLLADRLIRKPRETAKLLGLVREEAAL